MRHEFTQDVAGLPTHGFGPRSITWWGTYGFILIEATIFVLAAATYLYLMAQSPDWPPEGEPPDLLWGTLFTAVLLLSGVPNAWLKRAAEGEILRRARMGMLVLLVFGLALIAIRWFRRSERERDLLVLRRRRLAADLRPALLVAAAGVRS